MKITKSELSKIIIPSLVIILIGILLFISLENIRKRKYTEILNNDINRIISAVKEEYPNTSEEEIIKIIQKDNINSNIGRETLRQYGYSENKIYSIALEEETKIVEVEIIIVFIICGIFIIGVMLSFVVNQNRKIDKINTYLRKVNNGNYSLDIQDNSNSELSKLKNELYKTTVLLRESAENSKKENENLTNSLADISHQIKTPITSMQIMIDNLCENPEMDEETRIDFLQTISMQIDWISTLVIEILKLSKLESGTIEMCKNDIYVNNIINDIENNLAILLDIKNIKLIKNVSENAHFVADYKWQLEALTNIVKNAIEHSKENSIIYINVENTSVFLKIQIIDKGRGIKKEDLKHIFERFYKSNSSDNNMGIGLSLAKSIIEKNNGYITVDSKEGEGTVFTIKYLK